MKRNRRASKKIPFRERLNTQIIARQETQEESREYDSRTEEKTN